MASLGIGSSETGFSVDARNRCPNHLRPPKIASGGTLTFNGLRPGGRICPSNLVQGDGIHYAITSYAIELRPPPYLFETQGLGLGLGARARARG